MKVLKAIANFFNDKFFWELLDAQHSPDSKAMTRLFEDFSETR